MNSQQIDDMLAKVRSGISLNASARLVGLSVPLVYSYLERGSIEAERLAYNPKLKPRKSEEGCLQLWLDYSEADAEFQAKLELSVIRAGLDGEYKASLKMLEARYPNQYGQAAVRTSLKEVDAADESYEIEG